MRSESEVVMFYSAAQSSPSTPTVSPLAPTLVEASPASSRYAPGVAPRRWRRYAHHAARCVFGAMFFVFGLNGFLNFIPPPSGPVPAGALAFGGALLQTGYMLPMIKGTEILAGALILANRFVPLALAMLAPVVVNIFAFHAFLAPAELGVAAGVVLLEAYLAWAHRAAFRPMLAARDAAPVTSG